MPVCLLFVVALLFLPVDAAAVHDELRLCTQNLFRFGARDKKASPARRAKQRDYLIGRMKEAGCDAVALQEVVGANKKEAQAIAEELAAALSAAANRRFRAITGESLDEHIRNGFLIADDIGTVGSVESISRRPLPKLQPLGPPNFSKRAPLVVEIALAEQHRPGSYRTLVLISFHLKSKHDSWKDGTQTAFEALRMEEAENLRRLYAETTARLGGSALVVLLGDRNSDLESASAAILSGRRTLADFTTGSCSLTTDHTPSCKIDERPAELVALFAARRRYDPQRYKAGSYRFRGKREILDEILIPQEALSLVRLLNGRFTIGYRGRYFRGSDHLLAWAALAPSAGIVK